MTFHVFSEDSNGVFTFAGSAKAENACSAAQQVAGRCDDDTFWAVPAINPPLSVEQVSQLVSFGFLSDLQKSFSSY